MSFWGGGKGETFCLIWNADQVLGDQIGISHVPLRPVVLQRLCNNAGLGDLGHAEEHCPRLHT